MKLRTKPAKSHAAISITIVRGKVEVSIGGKRIELATCTTCLQARRFVPAGPRPWLSYPAPCRDRASKRKRVLAVFHAAHAEGMSVSEAIKKTQKMWRRLTGSAVSAHTICHWRRVILKAGGIEHAPREAYLDQRSCPHHANRKTTKRSAGAVNGPGKGQS